MNLYEDQNQMYENWGQSHQAIFYEPRTIPSGWDLSEYLPANSGNTIAPNFVPQEDITSI